MNICKERELCSHYIWHYEDAPTTHHDKECVVVDVEPGAEDSTYRSKDINTVTGSCSTGSTSGYNVIHSKNPPLKKEGLNSEPIDPEKMKDLQT